uniref:Thioredoxin domain-containing protein 8 n=1 Tax=Jaculus jaculus TaxID=51337 RepID=A0A8C5JV52_JACJA
IIIETATVIFLNQQRSFISKSQVSVMVQTIKDMKELKALLIAAGHRLVVVEFSAKWCVPCKKMRPIFEEMSLKYKNVVFANVDVDQSRELAETCNIKAVPTFQMFKQNTKVNLFSRFKRTLCCVRSGFEVKEIYEVSGADPKKLEEKIKELM